MFDRKGHVGKLCLIFLPLLVAALVAVSRVDDYWHHWQDVFGGAIIGLLIYHFRFSFFNFQIETRTVLEYISLLLTVNSLHFPYTGMTVATFCYLQFFPPPYDSDGMSFISLPFYIAFCLLWAFVNQHSIIYAIELWTDCSRK